MVQKWNIEAWLLSHVSPIVCVQFLEFHVVDQKCAHIWLYLHYYALLLVSFRQRPSLGVTLSISYMCILSYLTDVNLVQTVLFCYWAFYCHLWTLVLAHWYLAYFVKLISYLIVLFFYHVIALLLNTPPDLLSLQLYLL